MDTGNLLHVRDDFTLQGIIGSFEELSRWRTSGKPWDVHRVHNALIMRACCCDNQNYWPCLLDPDNVAETWVRALRASPLRQRYPIVRVPANYTGAPTREFVKITALCLKFDSQSNEPGFESHLLPFQILGIFVLSSDAPVDSAV